MSRNINPILIDRDDNEKRYYTSAIPDAYVETSEEFTYVARVGDRWDKLAYKYLGSPKYWYVIARANGGVDGSLFIKPGTIVKIPEKI